MFLAPGLKHPEVSFPSQAPSSFSKLLTLSCHQASSSHRPPWPRQAEVSTFSSSRGGDNVALSHIPPADISVSHWLSKDDLSGVGGGDESQSLWLGLNAPIDLSQWGSIPGIKVAENQIRVSHGAMGMCRQENEEALACPPCTVGLSQAFDCQPKVPLFHRQRAPWRPASAPGREQRHLCLQRTVLSLKLQRPGLMRESDLSSIPVFRSPPTVCQEHETPAAKHTAAPTCP